jgi:hypothetical protein
MLARKEGRKDARKGATTAVVEGRKEGDGTKDER